MSALTDDLEAKRQDGEIIEYPVKASTTIYKGALAAIDTASGYLTKASDAANLIFVGVAVEQGDNSSGSNGDVDVRIFRTGTFQYACSSADQTWVGKKVYAVDDQTVALTSGNSLTTPVWVGVVVEYISATSVKVAIDGAAFDGTKSAA